MRDPDDIRALFTERLAALADALDPGFGFDMARLSVLVAEPCPPEQIGIGGAEDEPNVDRLVDRLSARLGMQRVRQLIAQDSHIPEIAGCCVPAQMAVTDSGWQAFRRFRAEAIWRRGRCGCCESRSRSRLWPKCRTARRCASAGGARCTR